MVGHTGKLKPAVSALETIDACIGRIVDAAAAAKATVFITADHGNCETMIDPVTGQPHTAHTTNPIPFIAIADDLTGRKLRTGGRLADVAPTVLDRMGIAQPPEMDGRSLFGMSISKRLIDLARSELNSLLDKAAARTDDERRRSPLRRRAAQAAATCRRCPTTELAAEIERRRRRARRSRRRCDGRRRPPPRAAAAASPPPPRRTAAGDDAIRKAYAALEVPPGSDFETVRKSYRRLMRKYHPDLHAGTPDKNRAATDLTQRLTAGVQDAREAPAPLAARATRAPPARF